MRSVRKNGMIQVQKLAWLLMTRLLSIRSIFSNMFCILLVCTFNFINTCIASTKAVVRSYERTICTFEGNMYSYLILCNNRKQFNKSSITAMIAVCTRYPGVKVKTRSHGVVSHNSQISYFLRQLPPLFMSCSIYIFVN